MRLHNLCKHKLTSFLQISVLYTVRTLCVGRWGRGGAGQQGSLKKLIIKIFYCIAKFTSSIIYVKSLVILSSAIICCKLQARHYVGGNNLQTCWGVLVQSSAISARPSCNRGHGGLNPSQDIRTGPEYDAPPPSPSRCSAAGCSCNCKKVQADPAQILHFSYLTNLQF